jgi:hypothetical protein
LSTAVVPEVDANDSDSSNSALDGEEPPVPGPEPRRYPDGERKPPRRDKAMIYSYMVTTSPDDPLFVGEALSRSDASEWRAAMNDEYDSLIQNETWDIVDRPVNRRVISSKWVFKLKRDDKGNPLRYKARLVASLFSLVQDFGRCFAENWFCQIKDRALYFHQGLSRGNSYRYLLC